ncbi:MAG: hypothetical protein ABJO27_09955 [Pseudoruegeria sp.]
MTCIFSLPELDTLTIAQLENLNAQLLSLLMATSTGSDTRRMILHSIDRVRCVLAQRQRLSSLRSRAPTL